VISFATTGVLPPDDVLREAAKRNLLFTGDTDTAHKIKGKLFDKQLAFVEDSSRRKAGLCSRRAGKTYAVCAYLLIVSLLYPENISVYITLSRKNARRLIWAELKRFNRYFNLNIEFNNVELEATLPNNSQIWLTGAKDSAEIEKLRGHKFRLAVLDECASFGAYITDLIEDILEPTMLDLDGSMCMIGTPNAACAGKFFEITTDLNQGWSIHKWTVLQNPHIPHAKAWLQERMRVKGWDEEHPTYLREWCGRWVRSIDSLVYRYTEGLNDYVVLPDGEDWEHVLGIDLGFEDATAFQVASFSRDLPNVYFGESIKKQHMIPTEIGEAVQVLDKRYNFTSIVCDTGGLGKSIAMELRQRFGIAIKPAEKTAKFTNIELLNGDLRAGRVKALIHSQLIDEWKLLQWDEDRKKEDERFANHLADAALYAYRECKHYLYEPALDIPTGPAEEARQIERQLAEKMQHEEKQSWWDKSPFEYTNDSTVFDFADTEDW